MKMRRSGTGLRRDGERMSRLELASLRLVLILDTKVCLRKQAVSSPTILPSLDHLLPLALDIRGVAPVLAVPVATTLRMMLHLQERQTAPSVTFPVATTSPRISRLLIQQRPDPD
jgi:hypothetical protein